MQIDLGAGQLCKLSIAGEMVGLGVGFKDMGDLKLFSLSRFKVAFDLQLRIDDAAASFRTSAYEVGDTT